MALMTMQISCQKIMFFYVSIIFELKSGKLLNLALINIFCKAVARKDRILRKPYESTLKKVLF